MATPTYTPGRFIWHELFTPDIEKSKAFYGELFGWTTEDMPMGDSVYVMLKAGGKPVGGLMNLSVIEMEGVPPNFHGYVSAPEIDATAAAVVEAGGQVLVGPHDCGEMGRAAVIQDPQGAVFSLWRSTEGDQPEPTSRPGVGEFCWDQLATTDPDAAAEFYGKVLGWERKAFGEADDHWVFTRGEGGDKYAAGLMPAQGGAPSHWGYYVVVDDLAAARQRVLALGGKVLMEEIPVPGIGRFAVIQDNVGAIIAPFQGD